MASTYALVFAALLLAVAVSAQQGAYGGQQAGYGGHQEEQYGPVHYSYGYAVKDEHTKDIKEHKETRKGDRTEGEYSLLEADGTTRTVKYYVDGKSGFVAQVIRSGHAVHAPAQPKVAYVQAAAAAAAPQQYSYGGHGQASSYVSHSQAPRVNYVTPQLAHGAHASSYVSHVQAPIVAYKAAPIVAYKAPIVAYKAPIVAYKAPIVTYKAPIVTYQSAPIVVKAAPQLAYGGHVNHAYVSAPHQSYGGLFNSNVNGGNFGHASNGGYQG